MTGSSLDAPGPPSRGGTEEALRREEGHLRVVRDRPGVAVRRIAEVRVLGELARPALAVLRADLDRVHELDGAAEGVAEGAAQEAARDARGDGDDTGRGHRASVIGCAAAIGNVAGFRSVAKLRFLRYRCLLRSPHLPVR